VKKARQLVEPKAFQFGPDGTDCPNNPSLPVLIYQEVFEAGATSIADQFESAFHDNGWTGSWRWSVYDFHHYHSNAHEALGVSKGSARLQLGGSQGEVFDVSAGTLIILPAGTGHKNLQATPGFLVVGAYPNGQGHYDTNRNGSMDFDKAMASIARTPLPENDPVYGPKGPLVRIWRERP